MNPSGQQIRRLDNASPDDRLDFPYQKKGGFDRQKARKQLRRPEHPPFFHNTGRCEFALAAVTADTVVSAEPVLTLSGRTPLDKFGRPTATTNPKQRHCCSLGSDRAQVGDLPRDTLRRAITQMQPARGIATGIVINLEALERIELDKDADGNYVLSLPVSDGNGRTTLWRVPCVVSDVLTADEFLVGDFTRAARLYDRQIAHLEISLSHADYFVRNLVALLAEERLALTIPRPTMLVKGTFA